MIIDLIQVVVLFISVIICFRYARRTEDNLYLVFSALSAVTLMLSTLYYLAHSILLEGVRVPFAANDIADFGTFLLISAALNTAVGANWRKLHLITAAAAIFAAANVFLWISWSGEWLRDILGGLPFGIFICSCVRSIYLTGAMKRWERSCMWTLCFLLTAVETVSLYLPGTGKTVMETIGAALMGVGALLLLVRIFLQLRSGRSANAAVALSFSGFCWNSICMYMSADPVYSVFSGLCILNFLLILLSIRKKVREPA